MNSNVLKEYYNIIAYNFRRLRWTHKQTHEEISDKSGIARQELNFVENEKRCSLPTLIGLAIHFGVNFEDFVRERMYPYEYLNTLKKKQYIRLVDIPKDMRVDFSNFFASEISSVPTAYYLTWLNYLDYKRGMFKVRRTLLEKKIDNLIVGESFQYIKQDHIYIFNYICSANIGGFELRLYTNYVCKRIY